MIETFKLLLSSTYTSRTLGGGERGERGEALAELVELVELVG